jgi:hypothetical protein
MTPHTNRRGVSERCRCYRLSARTREYLTLTFAAMSLAVVPVARAVWRLTNG